MSESHDGGKTTTGTGKDAALTSHADAIPARPGATRRFRRPHGGPARGARRRRVMLAAAAAGALAAALLGAPPARAADCNLKFYYNVDGSLDWPGTSVASDTSCSETPAIVRYTGGTTIASNSDGGGVVTTYVNTDGSPTWSKNDWWWGWGTFAPLAMTAYSGGTEFAIAHSNEVGTLMYAWETGGQPIQSGQSAPVASSGISLFAPAIARNSAGTVIAATGTDNSLWFYWNADGSPAWGSHQVVGPSLAYGAPAIAVTGTGTEIAFIAPDASLWFYWNVNGTSTWWPEEVSGPGTVWGGVAMTHSYGGTQISAPGPGGSLMFFWNADGTSTWHPQQVAGAGTMQGAPAMVAGNHTEAIAVTAPDGSLRYYWSWDGTTTWYGAQIAPPGTASTSPAIIRSSAGIEIAVAGP
jgi:hypothetical protein